MTQLKHLSSERFKSSLPACWANRYPFATKPERPACLPDKGDFEGFPM